METAVPGSGACSRAVLADLYRRDLRPERGALPSIIPPGHAGIISEAVEARAGVLPSELLQLSFRALLKMGTVFADCRASEPSVARRATGPAWAHCCAPRQRACGFMEHGCGQALSAPVHEEGVGGERSALQGSAGQWLGAACEQHASLRRAAVWAASAREHSLMRQIVDTHEDTL
jgi:hypothetical protein